MRAGINKKISGETGRNVGAGKMASGIEIDHLPRAGTAADDA
jgi:hypothetical protein